MLVLDEAHSFGVIGLGGRGAAAGIGAEPDLIRTVTLSKALAGQGGAVLAAPEVIGVRVGCFRPPAVPADQACPRLAARASLTESDFAAAGRALAAAR